MAVYHVIINQVSYEVDATSTVEAINIALDTYVADSAGEPDNCEIDASTQGLEIVACFAGDLVIAPAVAP